MLLTKIVIFIFLQFESESFLRLFRRENHANIEHNGAKDTAIEIQKTKTCLTFLDNQ